MSAFGRAYEHGMFHLGTAFRRSFYTEKSRFPWHFWVRLAYNDALTYDGSNGGVKASWRFNPYIKAGHNKEMIAFANHLQIMK